MYPSSEAFASSLYPSKAMGSLHSKVKASPRLFDASKMKRLEDAYEAILGGIHLPLVSFRHSSSSPPSPSVNCLKATGCSLCILPRKSSHCAFVKYAYFFSPSLVR